MLGFKREQPNDSLFSENEQKIIKKKYLSIKQKDKKEVKPKRGFKKLFKFEWDNAEDTMAGEDLTRREIHDANLMFGRGSLGGTKDLKQNKLFSFK